jgi:branched-chain amino acid transport system ATP-binding protein
MLLRVEKVTKSFDGFVAVQDVDLTIVQGRWPVSSAPTGRNRQYSISLPGTCNRHGENFFHDRDITGLLYTVCQLGMGRSFQRTNIFPRLSVFDNVQVAVLAHRKKTLNFFTPSKKLLQDETYALLDQVGLAAEARSISGMLSYGFQKQLELGIALASEPELLLLDEPTAGMSPQETTNTIALIAKIVRERGLTLLFTEHDMDVVFSIAEKITVLHQGQVLAEGTPAEVRSNPEVQRVYLGETV